MELCLATHSYICENYPQYSFQYSRGDVLFGFHIALQF